MKKLFSVLLAAAIFLCAAGSCAMIDKKSAPDPMISVTSSDAEGAAAWLGERLGDVPERVILGTSADGYGVDLYALEDDGYVIRRLDGEIALFARTANGLDRAVRRYAKAVEAGESVADETYHEGYRIKTLRLAGADISEWAIRVEDGNDYYRSWVTNNVAVPMSVLFEKACGFAPSVGGESGHKIVFRRIEDENFKESSFRYYFADGDLILEYADFGGARNAMAKFLENECGWTDLLYGIDDLKCADLIDVSADTNVTCHPRFDGIRLVAFSSFTTKNSFGAINSGAFMYKYRVESAHHYLGSRWASDFGQVSTGHLICLTDESVLCAVVEDVSEYVRSQIGAGKVIGEDLVAVNMGMEDSRYWCSCKNCRAVYLAEGGTWAGPLIRFLNSFDALMDEAGYAGLKYPTFGYVGSNKPPKLTIPGDDIYITFVYNNSCTHHCMDGSQCSTLTINSEYGEWVEGWLGITDNLYVRPAPLSAPIHACTVIDQVWDDVNWLGDIGVKCLYNEIYTYNEFDTNLIAAELWEALTFNADMTRAGYYEECARLFEKYYGDGWKHVLGYISLLEKVENATGKCWSVWNSYDKASDPEQFDLALYREMWDEMLAELEAARLAANSAETERRVDLLLISALYEGCCASYYHAYEEEDDALLSLVSERWAKMIDLAAKCGVTSALDHYGVKETAEKTAWEGAWAKENDRSYIMFNIEGRTAIRPAPAD